MADIVQRPKELLFTGNLPENWKRFHRQWEIYRDATDIEAKTEKQKIAIFLNVAGVEATEVYDSWEEIPAAELKLTKVIEKFATHCQGTQNVILFRYKFWTRNQNEGENFRLYYQALRQLVADCKYSAELKNEMLRDKICVGIRSDNLRERLFREKSPTLEKVLEIIETAEASKTQVADMKQLSGRGQEVSELRKQRRPSKVYNCTRCGTKHEARKCPAYGKQCLKCKAMNHFAQCCRTQRKPSQEPPAFEQRSFSRPTSSRRFQKGKAKSKKVYATEVTSETDSSQDDYELDFMIDTLFCEDDKTNQSQDENDSHELCYDDVNSSDNVMINTLFEGACMCNETNQDEKNSLKVCNDMTCSLNEMSTEWFQNVMVHEAGQTVNFKLDSGAQISVIPNDLYEKMGRPCVNSMKKSKVKISTYNKEKLNVAGKIVLTLEHKHKLYPIEFYIVHVKSVPILGLNALTQMNLVQRIHSLQTDSVKHTKHSQNPLEKYKDVFQGVGAIPGEYNIQLQADATPVVYPVRRVPESLKPKLKESLDSMVRNNIIAAVEEPTDWVNSLVIVEKPDKSLRICLDPRELNKSIKREHFHIPTLEEIQAKLAGCKFFTTLDCSTGYWHVKLSRRSSYLTTFNTPFGRYRYLRMPYGISSAQEIFQRKVSQILEGIEGTLNFVDDILIFAPTEEEHDRILEKVLQKCRESNIKLNKSKCQIKKIRTKYLGHIISGEGMYPDPDKVEAIAKMQTPSDKQGVHRLLGLVNWLARFIPNMSDLTEPLRILLKKDIEFHWQPQQEKAFQNIKEAVTNQNVLKFYDVNQPVAISADASKSGLGAVLLQGGQPVAYASRALTTSEQNYAQIEKECLSVVFACERFHQYVYGKQVKVENDHKPLEAIFRKPLIHAPPRIQRMLIRLQKYDIVYVYKKGTELHIADALSRAHPQLTQQKKSTELEQEIEYYVHCVHRDSQMTLEKTNQVKKATSTDPEMKSLIKMIQEGWPNSIKDCKEVQSYFTFRDELSVCDGIIMKGTRIVIPKDLRPDILRKLHTGHWGIERTRRRARDTVFWPGISTHIQKMIENCEPCCKFQNSNPRETIMMHQVPDTPFERVGTDLFHYRGHDYLLVADYYSKFWDVARLPDTKSSTVIRKTKAIFARFGIPSVVVSDNGPQRSINSLHQRSINSLQKNGSFSIPPALRCILKVTDLQNAWCKQSRN